jgi:hypothetical protein
MEPIIRELEVLKREGLTASIPIPAAREACVV